MPNVEVDDLHARLVDAIPRHMRRDGTINYTTLGAEFDRHRSNIKRRVAALGVAGALGFAPIIPGFGVSQVTTQYRKGDMVGESIQQKPLGEQTETVPKGFAIKGVSTLRDAHGNTIVEWTKTREESVAEEVTRDAIIEMFSEYRGKSGFIASPLHSDDDLLTLYPTSDVHIGLQAWGRETGTSWDLQIAKDTLLGTAAQLYQCSPASHTAILLDLGDYTHANDQKNVTPGSGHQLDVDGRFPKIVKEAVKIRRALIEMALQKHERVIYRGLPGNHDPEVAQMLSIALALFFENNPRIEIDDDPSDFWFYQHGLCMLAANHGHRLKPDKLPGVMAAYKPKMWGSTEYRYGFSGHIHHETSGEENGARWETLRTIAARDAYSHQHGYLSGRELTSITYSATAGQRHRQYIPVSVR